MTYLYFIRVPLATSSLAVGRFAAKKGSLRSPRGRLVAGLGERLVLRQTLDPTFNPMLLVGRVSVDFSLTLGFFLRFSAPPGPRPLDLPDPY